MVMVCFGAAGGARCGMVLYSFLLYGIVWYDMVWHGNGILLIRVEEPGVEWKWNGNLV